MSPKPPTILIADDYDDNRELLRLVLCGAGYQVREANNGLACVEMARTQLPDLVMVDLSMPGIDGWGVLKELQADPRTAGIPCVAVTAYDADRKTVIELGFMEYVSKPFKTVELLRVVGELLTENKRIPPPEPVTSAR
jgi:CheY-like chemotaxis protein